MQRNQPCEGLGLGAALAMEYLQQTQASALAAAELANSMQR